MKIDAVFNKGHQKCLVLALVKPTRFLIISILIVNCCNFIQALDPSSRHAWKWNGIGKGQGYGQKMEPSQNYEDVQVRFLTKLRSTREIHSHDYHILEVRRTSSAKSDLKNSSLPIMIIHLTRTENLLSQNFTLTINNGRTKRHIQTTDKLVDPNLNSDNENQAELLETEDGGPTEISSGNCIYSGVLSDGSGNETSVLTSVALSACGEHPGFTGLIMTPEGTYLLAPKSEYSSAAHGMVRPKRNSQEVAHTLTLIHSKDSNNGGDPIACGNELYSDFSDKDNINSENTEPEPQLALTAHNIYDEFSKSIADFLNSLNLKSKSKSGNNVKPGGGNASLNSKGAGTGTGTSTGTKTGAGTGSGTTNRVIELAVFAEHSFLELHKKTLQTKSLKVIQSFILLLVQATRNFFQLTSLEEKFDIQLVHMELMTKNPSSLNTNHGLHAPFIESFCKYAHKLNADYSKWDHAMMLTGLDLRTEDSDAIVGVAYTSAMCSTQSCSLIEATNFKAPKVMAHEMGHSIGMSHDGEADNKACPHDKNIMAALSTPLQNTWSTCSNQNMKSYLTKLESGRYRNTKGNCLKVRLSQTGTGTGTGNEGFTFNSKLPGERFTPNEQCVVYDKEYPNAVIDAIASRYGLKYSICQQLYCAATSWKTAMYAHAALEGTECEAGKWCRNSECVKKI